MRNAIYVAILTFKYYLNHFHLNHVSSKAYGVDRRRKQVCLTVVSIDTGIC